MVGSTRFTLGRRTVLRTPMILAFLQHKRDKALRMQSDNLVMDALAQKLTSARSNFFSEPSSFSWWLRGGEPGSPSDYLVLEGERGSVTGTFIRARFDPDHEPPNYVESFKGPVDPNRVFTLLQQLFASPLFRQKFEEEDDRGMRDLQAETWTFSRGGITYKKTLFEPLPASLEELRKLCREIAEQLVRYGQRSEKDRAKPPGDE
jgi:hypothetical protein